MGIQSSTCACVNDSDARERDFSQNLFSPSQNTHSNKSFRDTHDKLLKILSDKDLASEGSTTTFDRISPFSPSLKWYTLFYNQ